MPSAYCQPFCSVLNAWNDEMICSYLQPGGDHTKVEFLGIFVECLPFQGFDGRLFPLVIPGNSKQVQFSTHHDDVWT